MAADLKVEFRDWEKVDKKLQQLPEKLRSKSVRAGTRNAAKPALKTARAKAPNRSGALKKSIILVPGPRANQLLKTRGEYNVRIGINPKTRVFIPNKDGTGAYIQRPIRYAHHAEFGNRRNAAQPFLRPAFNQQKRNFAKIAGREIGKSAEKEIAKL